MSLKKYQKKRKFDQTPEPEGIPKDSVGPLTFVIQKHEASRLHYDFRLELNGVLKSWAVPKGPSLNPHDRRLAVMVEDHPMDYANFEGIIPKGNYGGGTVMVWDKGVYTPYDATDREQSEKVLNEQLKKGHLTFILLGEKLKGEFALIKTHNSEEDAWIMIKKGDEFASEKRDILKEDKSALTGRTMSEIKNQKKDVWFSKPRSLNIDDTPKGAMLHTIKPMLANSVEKPFDNPEWIYEIKYDGYRAIAEIESGKVKLYSRNKISFNEKFAAVAQSLQKFPGNAVLDGEIVVVDSVGHPHFQWLQDYPDHKEGELIYYVFDMLFLDGHDLTSLPLTKRKELLQQILPPLPHLKYSGHIQRSGIAMFNQAKELGIEGIMAKNGNSQYEQGVRSDNWLKIKTLHRQEVVIAGFTNPKDGRKFFGSLIAGVYKDNQLTYVGHIGTGFDNAKIKSLHAKLIKLEQKDCPFDTVPETNAPPTWIKPKIVAEVEFSNWTTEGQMRHPVFVGLREDKSAEEVNQEKYFSKDPVDKENQEYKIGKQIITLTNLSKIFFPADKITKGDLINYYREIAPVILPYLYDRLGALLRYPNGIDGQSFYQKDAKLLHDDWIEKISIHSESNNKNISYLLCQDEATLIYLINLGCIDLNPWSSKAGQLDNPDYLLIDLDPEETDFKNIIKAALAVREVLESFDIPGFPKTSGASGMHIYIPLAAKYTYEQTRQLAELICIHVHNKMPDITSMIRDPKKRRGLVYLDYLQNIKGQTLASVYSVRAKPGATVSTPLDWSEVTSKLHPSQFTIKNVPARIQKHGDLFKPVLGKGIDIAKILKKLAI
jgi:bifunctional non-homologous end joining protein LigD